MGLYDREYIRVGPRSTSGLGSLRFVSANSWIIVLNVAVFLLGSLVPVLRAPVDVEVARVWQEGLPDAAKAAATVDTTRTALFTGARYPTYVHPLVVTASNGGVNFRSDVGQQLFIHEARLLAWGHFSTIRGFFGLEVWRFVTFQFLHANFYHILFNMFGLWVFGGLVEQYLGSQRYLSFYLVCGIFGAISYLILNLLGYGLHLRLPGVLIDDPWTPLIGASAGVFGVILACAYIAPDAIVQVFFAIPLRLKWFAYGYFAFVALNLLRGGTNAGGDAAHVGGGIAGYFFIRNAHLLRDFFDFFGGGGRGPQRPTDRTEVDRILSKVATQGLSSLTPDEKHTLRQATERQRRA